MMLYGLTATVIRNVPLARQLGTAGFAALIFAGACSVGMAGGILRVLAEQRELKAIPVD
jgi:hypothetical protein